MTKKINIGTTYLEGCQENVNQDCITVLVNVSEKKLAIINSGRLKGYQELTVNESCKSFIYWIGWSGKNHLGWLRPNPGWNIFSSKRLEYVLDKKYEIMNIKWNGVDILFSVQSGETIFSFNELDFVSKLSQKSVTTSVLEGQEVITKKIENVAALGYVPRLERVVCRMSGVKVESRAIEEWELDLYGRGEGLHLVSSGDNRFHLVHYRDGWVKDLNYDWEREFASYVGYEIVEEQQVGDICCLLLKERWEKYPSDVVWADVVWAIDNENKMVVDYHLTDKEKSLSVEEKFSLVQEKILKIIKEKKIQQLTVVELIKKMSESEKVISLEDSLAVGNCEEGSRRFMSTFGLPESMPLAKLAEHPFLRRMFEVSSFQRVIGHILEG